MGLRGLLGFSGWGAWEGEGGALGLLGGSVEPVGFSFWDPSLGWAWGKRERAGSVGNLLGLSRLRGARARSVGIGSRCPLGGCGGRVGLFGLGAGARGGRFGVSSAW